MSGSDLPRTTAPARRVSPGGVVAALVGAALFVYTIRQTGLADIAAGIRTLGWGFGLILALSGIRMMARALAWSLCTEGPHPLRLRETFPAFVTGDALGNLTPLGLFASEATKAMYVRPRVPLMTAVSGLTIENLIYTLTVGMMIAGGAVALLFSFTVSRALETLSLIALGGMVVVIAATAWILARQARLLSGLIDWLHHRRLAPGALARRVEKLRALEDRVYGFHRRHPDRLLGVLALEAAYHAAGVAEMFITLAWLVGPPGLLVAFIIESFNRLIIVAFKFVPMRLGVDEVASGLLLTVLGYTNATGVTLAIVRKVRVLCWTAVGLLFLARRGFNASTDAGEFVDERDSQFVARNS